MVISYRSRVLASVTGLLPSLRCPGSGIRIRNYAIAGACVILALSLSLLYHATYPQTFNGHTIHDSIQALIQPRNTSLLPRKIWQIFLMPPNEDRATFQIKDEAISRMATWVSHNPDYQYVLVGDKGAENFARRLQWRHPRLLNMLTELQNTGIKSDMLRYLILSIEGGIYSDIDTDALKPIDHWVPERYRRNARVVVGVEVDRWFEVQLCQWTIAATPGHVLFSSMLDSAISAVDELAAKQKKNLSDISTTANDIMNLSGPVSWTGAVLRHLQRFDPNISLTNFTNLTEPVLIDDILILPIDGFGMGQLHSNSTHDGSIPEDALVKHYFKGSWRHGLPEKVERLR